jgi:signal transduction histidine kinase
LDHTVTNLISNAIKFGLGRPIEVAIDAGDGRAKLTVTDHGLGIAKELRERIFEPFERGVSVRHYGGLGLGLHIARTLVEALGGSISVDSEPGVGSTFTVELPSTRAESQHAHSNR